MRVVDAHVHLWNPDRMCYRWLDGSGLNRRMDAAALRAASGAVGDFVAVQADCNSTQSMAEVRWLTEQADDLPGLHGIVAFAPLEQGDRVRDQLRALRDLPLVVGVRRLIQDERPGFAVGDQFLAALGVLGDVGFPFDICARSGQLDEVIEMVRRTPAVQFVLDHVGKPAIGMDSGTWRRQIIELAGLPNVVCKLSGLMTEFVAGPPDLQAVRPFLKHALAVFGPTRCLFGSDWPVMTTATTYPDWLALVSDLLPRGEDRRAVLLDTAERVYRLSVPAAE